jgi:hypothetical protein
VDITDYRMPDLYATDDDHVIMGEFSLTRLNSDLTSTSEVFTEKGHGRTIQISPDGSILAHETTPWTELLDSHNFLPTGIRLAESVPTAVSTDAVLTDDEKVLEVCLRDQREAWVLDCHRGRPTRRWRS